MSQDNARPRLYPSLLLLVVFLGYALRLYHLDVQSLWYDEGVTAQVARLGVGELAGGPPMIFSRPSII